MSDDKPIIVVKKKGGHGGHHGGAWKVAYADFVTAMMAFFMVMWLLNSADVTTRQNIASYFKKPGLFHQGSGTPLLIGEAGILDDAFVPPHPSDQRDSKGQGQEKLPERSGTDPERQEHVITPKGGEAYGLNEGPKLTHGYKNEDLGKQGVGELDGTRVALEQLAEKVRQQISSEAELEQLLGMVDIHFDTDGLNIEIMDTNRRSMFAKSSARIQPQAKEAFASLARIMKDLPNEIEVSGHTDGIPFSANAGGYSNWELSADRANAARRVLELEGVSDRRIIKVSGRADREPKVGRNPFAAANRRINIKLKFETAKTEEEQELEKADDKPEQGLKWAPKKHVRAETAEDVQERKRQTFEPGNSPLFEPKESNSGF